MLDMETECFTRYYSGWHENSLLNNEVRCLFLSGHGELWVGYPDGLDRIILDESGKKVTEVTSYLTNSELDPNVRYICSLNEDKHGRLLIGTRKGLFMLERSGKNFSLSQTVFDTQHIQHIYRDNADNLWISTRTGLYYISSGRQNLNDYLRSLQPVILPGSMNSQITKILQVTENNYLIATEKSGIFRLELQSNEKIEIKPVNFTEEMFFINNSIKSLLIDRTLNVWITSRNAGIARFDLNEKK